MRILEDPVAHAIAYLRDDTVIATALEATDAGVHLIATPCVTAPASDPTAIGDAVVCCLDAFSPGVPHPTDWPADREASLHRAAGVRSRIAFHRGTRMLDVSRAADGRIDLTPTRNLGSRAGFEQIVERSARVGPSPDALALGEALLRAFASCDDS